MANDNKSSKGAAITKTDNLGIVVSQAPPAGMERVVAGAELAGYWRQITGDVLHGILRGPAPEAVVQASKGKWGVCVVELLEDCAVENNQKGYDNLATDAQKKLWSKLPLEQGKEQRYLRKAVKGELVMVSIREKAKDILTMPDGRRVWLKVGASRTLPSGNTMFDYECYAVHEAPVKQSSAQAERSANGIPAFD